MSRDKQQVESSVILIGKETQNTHYIMWNMTKPLLFSSAEIPVSIWNKPARETVGALTASQEQVKNKTFSLEVYFTEDFW